MAQNKSKIVEIYQDDLNEVNGGYTYNYSYVESNNSGTINGKPFGNKSVKETLNGEILQNFTINFG
jgi:hypothetical protein